MSKRSVSTAMKAHLAQGVTTLAMCWQVVRTDGQSWGFTSFDKDLVISGYTYRSIDGFTSTAIQSGATGQIDNLQVIGFFRDDGISQVDVKNRLFDYARIYLFFVNWANLNLAPIKMRTGWLGETVIAPNGSFMAELRGLTQALVQELGNVYSPLCRNDLGDSHCKIPILPDNWQPNRTYNEGDYVRALTMPNDTIAQAIFQANEKGKSAATEPIWDPTLGNTTPDFQIVWTCQPGYRQIGTVVTPIDQHSFIASALGYPAGVGIGTNGSISIINSVSSGSAIEVSDGIGHATISWDFDQKKEDAIQLVLGVLQSSGLLMTYSLSGTVVSINNHSGQKGSITKTGDILGAISIENFGDPVLDAGTVSWISGNNTGVSMELKHYDTGSSTVSMYLGMLMPIQTGDRFWYHPGCDKRRDTCVRKFNNIVNNRSEPDIPGLDKMLSYPDS